LADKLLMSYNVGSVGHSRFSPRTPDQVNRILVGVCAALWLFALGAVVAAIVALVDLGHGRSAAPRGSDTPWVLYAIIGVSAVVIVGAIPLLIRARRTGSSRTTFRPSTEHPGTPSSAPQRLDPFGAPVLSRHATPPASSRVAFPAAAVDQLWLRCTVVIAGTIGAVVTLIGVGTYLLASGYDAAAWTAFGLGALLTVAMPAAPWYFLRQLHGVLNSSDLHPRD
jgi:Protein of unknown function (DUF2561)